VVLSFVYGLPVRERILQVYGSGSSGNADRKEKEPEVQATAQATDMLPEEEQTDYQAMTTGAQSGESLVTKKLHDSGHGRERKREIKFKKLGNVGYRDTWMARW
jgi:hypothetical protein